jgi:hypothetical protein
VDGITDVMGNKGCVADKDIMKIKTKKKRVSDIIIDIIRSSSKELPKISQNPKHS